MSVMDSTRMFWHGHVVGDAVLPCCIHPRHRRCGRHAFLQYHHQLSAQRLRYPPSARKTAGIPTIPPSLILLQSCSYKPSQPLFNDDVRLWHCVYCSAMNLSVCPHLVVERTICTWQINLSVLQKSIQESLDCS